MAATPPELMWVSPGQLTRVRVSDAQDLAVAIRSSLDQLSAWLPWATEEAAQRTTQERRCEEAQSRWREGTEYAYVLRQGENLPVIGAFDLWRIGPDVFELGYWVHIDHAGKGYATSCAMALSQMALAVPGVRRVEIHTDAGNLASAAIPLHPGYQLARIEAVTPEATAHTGHVQIWSLQSP